MNLIAATRPRRAWLRRLGAVVLVLVAAALATLGVLTRAAPATPAGVATGGGHRHVGTDALSAALILLDALLIAVAAGLMLWRALVGHRPPAVPAKPPAP